MDPPAQKLLESCRMCLDAAVNICSPGTRFSWIGNTIRYLLYVLPETHKGLKRVTLICLLCLMLVIIHFRKYHVWNEKKRKLTNQIS